MYKDLRGFIDQVERIGGLRHVAGAVDDVLHRRGHPQPALARAVHERRPHAVERVVLGHQRGGQDRGSAIPSLNIHTNDDAENPSVAGGSLAASR